MPQVKIPPAPTVIPQPPQPVKVQPTPEPVFKPAVAAKPISLIEAATSIPKASSLEQKIGTRWILIAGIITSIVGVGFFLKYAYDNDLIGPLGRVVIAAVAGLVALAIGEATRRRGYGIVAKGTTALGFATLYAAVFSAYRFYQLIESAGRPKYDLAHLLTSPAQAKASPAALASLTDNPAFAKTRQKTP